VRRSGMDGREERCGGGGGSADDGSSLLKGATGDNRERGGLAAGMPRSVGPGTDRRATSRPRPGRVGLGWWQERE
jgi:hypothetical protein